MKKNYFLLILCFIVFKTVAQNNPTMQATEELPNWPVLLSNLNTSQITSGVLVDKITTFSNLINYNTTDINLSDAGHFNQALSELYRASDQIKFISLTELKNRTAVTATSNSVDIGFINTTFHKLNFNEENPSAGGLTYNQINGKLSSIAGRPAFVSKKIIIAAPLKEILTGNSFDFNFKNNLIFTNATTSIKTMVVDFEDGAVPATIISNGAIVTSKKIINYTTSGIKKLKFTVTFSDNSVMITYGKVYINYINNNQSLVQNTTTSACYEPLKDKGIFTSLLPFKGYTESSAVFGKIEYTVFYGDNNNAKQMIQPIIIVDGFDPKDKRKVLDCDCEQDPTCFSNNNDDGVFNPVNHESLEDLMDYDDGTIDPITGLPGKTNLIPELRSKGYDVIVINNPTYTSVNEAGQAVTIDGGADYIERNAYNLVSFIQSYVKVKQEEVNSTAQLVLIGPSMGGQITRYALAYMEKRYAEETDPIEKPKWQHNARLWVSVDSPHLGANIPVGAQANIWFFADRLGKEEAKIQFNEELNSVAGKQQIISQFKNGLETGYLNNNTFFTTYYNSLNTNGVTGSGGYPVTTSTFRKIAMTNGSLTGKKDANEQETFLYMRGYVRGLWPMQSSTITLLRLQDNFMPEAFQSGNVFKGDGQNSTFNVGFNHWYINFSHPRYSLSVNNNSITGSLDVVPGGTFKTAKYIRDAVSKELTDFEIRQETRDYIEDHSFISTFSALGHLQPNQNWGNPLNTNLTCPSNIQIPFDSYYGTENNTEHTSFTKESIEWLFQELDDNPQVPYFPVQDEALVGPNSICNNVNSTYTFDDLCKIPSAVTYNGNSGWSVEGNLVIVSYTDYSVIVKGTSNSSSTGKIKAQFQNGNTYEKNVTIGTPSFSGNMSGDNNPLTGEYKIYSVQDTSPNLQWYFDYGGTLSTTVNGWQILNGQGTSSISVKVGNTGLTYVVCKKTNGCGSSTKYIPVSVRSITDPCDSFKISIKNPIKQSENLTGKIMPPVEDPCDTPWGFRKINNKEEKRQSNIYDLYGRLVLSETFTGDSFNLQTQKLTKGTYILNITLSVENTQKETIIIE